MCRYSDWASRGMGSISSFFRRGYCCNGAASMARIRILNGVGADSNGSRRGIGDQYNQDMANQKDSGWGTYAKISIRDPVVVGGRDIAIGLVGGSVLDKAVRLNRMMFRPMGKVINEGSIKAKRPSWRQSEKDVSAANSDYETQKSFKNGEEVPYGTKGSVRPDNYKEGASIEVKNYDVTTLGGRNRLVDNITKQVEQRIEHLPVNTSQKVVIDVRGQNVSNDILREIRDSIVNKTGESAEIQFLR